MAIGDVATDGNAVVSIVSLSMTNYP